MNFLLSVNQVLLATLVLAVFEEVMLEENLEIGDGHSKNKSPYEGTRFLKIEKTNLTLDYIEKEGKCNALPQLRA